MTGNNEQNVSYPEFYKLNDQKLLFFIEMEDQAREI